jgi:SAM-dependent methyltransferase
MTKLAAAFNVTAGKPGLLLAASAKVFRSAGTAMGTDWHAYWSSQRAPGYPADESKHYARTAEELRWLLDGRDFPSILEIGCGSGALYAPMGFAQARTYVGVDFSPAMLEAFRVSHPEATLVCHPGHTYRDQSRYDLIFANYVVQYFSPPMFAEFLANMRSMMQPGGMIVLGLVPWRILRFQWRVGDLSSQQIPAWRRFGSYGKKLVKDDMEHWFTWRQVRRAAARQDLQASFYGSLTQPYRFHAVLQPMR